MNGSVTVRIEASPATVWALVSDVTQIGGTAPRRSRPSGSTGRAARRGARFRGHVRRNGIGPVDSTDCTVTVCEPERDFGFAVYANGSRVNSWRYTLTERDGGTEVTESFELTRSPLIRAYWALAGWRRRGTNDAGMLQTLERIKAVAEQTG